MKATEIFKNWIFPIFTLIFTALIIPFFWEYYVTVRPEIKNTAKDIQEIKNRMEIVESKYTKSDNQGKACKVGISRDKIGATVYIYNSKNSYLNLKSGDVINISNPYDIHRASIWCTVCIIETGQNTPTGDADMFLSREALNRLGINDFTKGVFNMSHKTRKDDL